MPFSLNSIWMACIAAAMGFGAVQSIRLHNCHAEIDKLTEQMESERAQAKGEP